MCECLHSLPVRVLMSSARAKVRATANNSAATAPRRVFIELEVKHNTRMTCKTLPLAGEIRVGGSTWNDPLKNLFKKMSLRSGAFARISSAMSARIIQVRPSRNPRWQKQGGWVVFEAEGVRPVYCGESARESALSYARQRAGYGRAEIQVLDEAWNVVETIGNEDARPLV